jgi:hypothetical protein
LKNLKFLFVYIGLFCISPGALAQKHPAGSISRCATMTRINNVMNQDPRLRLAPDAASHQQTGSRAQATRLTGIVTIPVVVHIVLPNPYLVTDADVLAQLDRLNLDFSGLNPDSSNAGNLFMSLRGHSQIRFCLAKRTPAGKLTSGIERRASATGSDINATKDPIKYSSEGGLDAWDPTQYLNYWVGADGTGSGILGYAQFPSSTLEPVSSDGVFINYQTWATNSCYTMSDFNMGRTAVHETGHYFGLLHTWGDDGNSCTGDDFADITTTGSSCSLPAALFNPAGLGNTASDVGDTPNQAGENSGCPSSSVITDACTAAGGGVMYQNMMDYSNDACLSLFTKKQVERMEWVLSNCRKGLTTSMGCQPPAGAATLDAAAVQSISPGGFETSACATTFYASALLCPGLVTPKMRIINNGLNNITSLTVGYRLNNDAAVTKTISLNLALGATDIVSFTPIAVTPGINTFTFFTSNPNGAPDQVTANDSLKQILTVLASTSSPVSETFDTPVFPPAGWAVDNYNADATWERKTPGRNASPGRLFINNYDVDVTGNVDDFKSSRVTTPGHDSVVISFDLAHKYYAQSGFHDTLSVLVTKDCGASYQVIYKKWGPSLATAGSSGSAYDSPAAEDWRTERIALSGSLLSSGELSVVFRNSSRYGNNIHIDNINIGGKKTAPSLRDLTITEISAPGAVTCTNTATPSVTVKNVGIDVITSFKIGYRLGSGADVIQTVSQTLAPNSSLTLTLAPLNSLSGTNRLTIFAADPVSSLGSGDHNAANDTLSKSFTVSTTVKAPLTEAFESSTFPPAGWAIANSDGGTTWQRTSNGNITPGSASVNTFNYGFPKQQDDLYTPIINYDQSDSVHLSFDLGAGYRSAGAVDTLTILATQDCGNSFITVYKKWGIELRTTNGAQANEFIPAAGQWRNERIDLSSVAKQGPLMLVFRVSNSNGNNIFIDNVDLTAKAVPQVLRRRGFLVLPTAFRDNFTLWYYQPPTDLKNVSVYNASGQLVYSRQMSGSTDRLINIDLAGRSSGSYLVRLSYNNSSKDYSQWLIKY